MGTQENMQKHKRTTTTTHATHNAEVHTGMECVKEWGRDLTQSGQELKRDATTFEARFIMTEVVL